jgi:rhodanese-related sulfurtransferase
MLPPVSPSDLAGCLGATDGPLVLDVCLPEDVAEVPDRIPGALRLPHGTADAGALARAAGAPVTREVVVACQRGLKLSLGVGARLHAQGVAARILAGGMAAWRAADLPVTPETALPASHLWACAEDPEADAALCHWLVTRFAPPGATLLLVPAASLAEVADRFAARPVTGPAALGSDLGVARLPALTALLDDLTPGRTLAHLLATAAARADRGQPDSPALGLLDLALSSRRSEIAA